MNYAYDNYDSTLSGLFGGFAVVVIILAIILLAFIVVGVIGLWKIYKKAGKSGWESIIPFYSYWVLVEIAGLNWWWFLLVISNSLTTLLGVESLSTVTNLASLFATFNIYYNIAKKFNKSNGTAVCAGLFSGIFILIFGFSKDEVYDINIPVSKNGVFGTPEMPKYNNMNNMSNSSLHATYYEQNSNLNSGIQSDQSVNNTNHSEGQTQSFSFCGNCGTRLNNDVMFCPNCGKEKL